MIPISEPRQRLQQQISDPVPRTPFALVEVADVRAVLAELNDAHVAIALQQSMLKVIKSLVSGAPGASPNDNESADHPIPDQWV